MSNQQKFDRLLDSLALRRIPKANLQRLIDELEAHREDIQLELEPRGFSREEAESEADRRTGDLCVLESAIVEHLRVTFLRRNPRVLYVISPLLLLPLCWTVGLACLLGAVELPIPLGDVALGVVNRGTVSPSSWEWCSGSCRAGGMRTNGCMLYVPSSPLVQQSCTRV